METTAKAVAALEAATEATNGLRGDVHDYTLVVKRVQWALVAAVVVMLVVLGAVGLVVKSSLDVLNTVASCTTPDGECRRESDNRVNGAVVGISTRTITGFLYTNECARLYPDEAGPAYEAKLRACVTKKLTARPDLFGAR
jgi:hypothetical protein